MALLAVGTSVTPQRSHAPTLGKVSVAQAAAPAAPAESPDSTDASPASADVPVTAQDVEVIADLDNLLSNEESRLWTDEDTTARF